MPVDVRTRLANPGAITNAALYSDELIPASSGRGMSQNGAQVPSYKQQSRARLQLSETVPANTETGRDRERPAPLNEAVSIADLSQSLPRPSYLACPRGYCAAADMPSPIFDMP
jgi:hypothetical protein